jgi:penicillin-binding protein 1A
MQNVNQKSHLWVWKYVMEKVHEGLEVKDFTPPDGVESSKICKISGKKANTYCPVVEEYFESGSTPSEWCSGHSGYYGASEYSYSGSSSSSSSSSSSTRKRTSSYSSSNYSNDNSYSSSDSSSDSDSGSSDTSTGADGTSSIFDTPSPDSGGSSDASEGIGE